MLCNYCTTELPDLITGFRNEDKYTVAHPVPSYPSTCGLTFTLPCYKLKKMSRKCEFVYMILQHTFGQVQHQREHKYTNPGKNKHKFESLFCFVFSFLYGNLYLMCRVHFTY